MSYAQFLDKSLGVEVALHAAEKRIKECNGLCVYASDLIECAPSGVAYPHDSCPLHGLPEEDELGEGGIPNFDDWNDRMPTDVEA